MADTPAPSTGMQEALRTAELQFLALLLSMAYGGPETALRPLRSVTEENRFGYPAHVLALATGFREAVINRAIGTSGVPLILALPAGGDQGTPPIPVVPIEFLPFVVMVLKPGWLKDQRRRSNLLTLQVQAATLLALMVKLPGVQAALTECRGESMEAPAPTKQVH